MCISKLAMALSLELIVVAIGLYFLHLEKKQDSRPLKLGGYLLSIMGLLLFLITTGVGIKSMVCRKCHQHGKYMGWEKSEGYMHKVQCQKKEREMEERDE